jgi:microcystin-dependent protein
MATPFLGEVKMISFNYAPKGWAFCNGQSLPINQNQAMFSILGTTYGGDGISTFKLPNLQGCVPLHMGNGFNEGQTGGAQTVTLAANQSGHGHAVKAAATATSNTAGGNYPAPSGKDLYGTSPDTTMNAGVVSQAGGGQPHPNLQPYLVINFVIALEGIFPSQN